MNRHLVKDIVQHTKDCTRRLFQKAMRTFSNKSNNTVDKEVRVRMWAETINLSTFTERCRFQFGDTMKNVTAFKAEKVQDADEERSESTTETHCLRRARRDLVVCLVGLCSNLAPRCFGCSLVVTNISASQQHAPTPFRDERLFVGFS